jgi:hypothetical protein
MEECMVERISISTAEAAILTEGALDNDGFNRHPVVHTWSYKLGRAA